MAPPNLNITHRLWAELLDHGDEQAFLESTWHSEGRQGARIAVASSLLFLTGALLDRSLEPSTGLAMTAGRVLVFLLALVVWHFGRRAERTPAWDRVLFAFVVIGPVALFISRTLNSGGELSPGWTAAILLFVVAGTLNLYPLTPRWLVASAAWMLGLSALVLHHVGLDAAGMFVWVQIIGFICAGTTYRVLSLQRERRHVWRVNRDLTSVNKRVTELLAANEKTMAELRLQAETDPLTGAFNRRGGEALARAMIARGGSASVLVADLDRFKAVNDTWGHGGGDRALCHVVHMMRAAGRLDDLIIRWGGDELVMVLWDPEEKAGREVGHRLVSTIRQTPILHDGHSFSITLSVGGVTGHGRALDAMIAEADQALYAAKERGRDRVIFSEELPEAKQATQAA